MKQLFLLFFLASFLLADAQSSTEIFLFDMKADKAGITISNGQNITNHKGYDNQPFFHPSQPIVYYSSFNDSGRSDIKIYNYNTKSTSNLTNTREREYSPTVTPDGKFISCIIQRDNGVQDLAKYPIDGGKPVVLINHLKVGYHAWAGENKLLMFILDDSIHNSLHYYYLDKNADTVLAENIGRSLHRIPSQNAMSFVQKVSDKQSMIKKFDMNTGIISTITETLPGQDQLTWLKDGRIIMSDGAKLWWFQPGNSKEWKQVLVKGDTSMLKGVTRLATNTSNSKLTVVVTE